MTENANQTVNYFHPTSGSANKDSIRLGSVGSASLCLSGAGGTNRLHLCGGEARDVLVHVQGIAHGSAAIPGSSIGLPKHSGGLRQGSPDGGKEDDQAVGGRRSIRRRGKNGIFKAELMVELVGGHGSKTVRCGVRPREGKD